MPWKYPKEKKLDAIELFMYGLPVSAVHARTRVPTRTLHRWKKQWLQSRQPLMAEKDSSDMANLSQNPPFRHKSQDSCPNTTADCHKTRTTGHKETIIDPRLTHYCQSESAIAEDQHTDHDDLLFIRAQLMKCARKLAIDLEAVGPDINIRSLALSRVLDRIEWLDDLLPSQENEQVIRFEYSSDGVKTEAPHWAMDKPNPQEAFLKAMYGDDYDKPR